MTEKIVNTDAYGLISAAQSLKQEKCHEEALRVLACALGLCGNDCNVLFIAHNEAAQIYMEMKDWDRAISELKKALECNKEDRDVRLSLATAYVRKNMHAQALAELGAALELPVNDAKALSRIRCEIARVYFEEKEYGLSLTEGLKAVELDDTNAEAHSVLGGAYQQEKRYGPALAEYGRALELQGTAGKAGPFIRAHMAQIYFEQSDYTHAAEECGKVLRDDPGSEQARLTLGAVHAANKEYGAAEAEFREAAGINPSSVALLELIKIFKATGQVDACVEANNAYWPAQENNDARDNRALETKIISLGKNGPGARALKIKIIRTPYFEALTEHGLNYSVLLPLGMGQIVSYLKANGINIEQDDLYLKINHDNMQADKEGRIDPDIFLDEKRVVEYSGGKKDEYLDSLMARAASKTELSGYDVILLSVYEATLNPSGRMFLLAFARYLKERYSPVIIVGGTDWEMDLLARCDSGNIDIIGRGEGEKLLFAVLTALRYGANVEEVPGIVKRPGGKEFSWEGRSFGIEPDYQGLPLELYGYKRQAEPGLAGSEAIVNEFYGSGIKVAAFRLMDGCFYGCIFCGCSNGREVFVLSPRKAVERLRAIKEKYGIRCFLFLNPMINMSKKYVNDLCDEIIGSGLDILWSDCARADNLDRETLVKMKKAGCVRLIYGLETASPRLLKYIDKRVNLDRVRDIIRWTDEAGILAGIEIICGFPGETQEDLRLTVDFINENAERLHAVYCTILYVQENSRLHSHPERYGIENIVDVGVSGKEFSRVKYGYDETGGLRWEEKLETMKAGYDYILGNVGDKRILGDANYDMEHFMFYLSSRFTEKNEVKNIIKNASRVLNV